MVAGFLIQQLPDPGIEDLHLSVSGLIILGNFIRFLSNVCVLLGAVLIGVGLVVRRLETLLADRRTSDIEEEELAETAELAEAE